MFSLSWQDREQELEQLTKELRQVNLQQFIQQTGTKVTVLPADPVEVEAPQVELERGAALRMLVGGWEKGMAAHLPAALVLALTHEVNVSEEVRKILKQQSVKYSSSFQGLSKL